VLMRGDATEVTLTAVRYFGPGWWQVVWAQVIRVRKRLNA